MELHAIERSRTEQTVITGECTTVWLSCGGKSRLKDENIRYINAALHLLIKGNLTVLDNGAESKWEYMGFGIWENREGGSPSPPPPGKPV
jgi:hypothetical protein